MMRVASLRLPEIRTYARFRQKHAFEFALTRPVHLRDSQSLAFLPHNIVPEGIRSVSVALPSGQCESIPSFFTHEKYAALITQQLGANIGALVRLGAVPLFMGNPPNTMDKLERQELEAVRTHFQLNENWVYLQEERLYLHVPAGIIPLSATRNIDPNYSINSYPAASVLLNYILQDSREATDPQFEAPPDEEAVLQAETTVRMQVMAADPGRAETEPPTKPAPQIGPTDLGWAYGTSYIGKRKSHEDNFSIGQNGKKILIVADGMGGHQAGEVASMLAVGVAYNWILDGAPVEEAIQAADKIIKSEAAEDSSRSNMGTTLDVIVIEGKRASIGHTGDGRIYHVREEDGEVSLLTEDHAFTMTMARRQHPELAFPMRGRERIGSLLDILEETAADLAPQFKSVVTNALGATANPAIATCAQDLEPGDWLLICSDGLHGPLGKRLAQILEEYKQQGRTLKELEECLSDEVLPLMNDNFTIVLYEHWAPLDPSVSAQIRQTLEEILLGNLVPQAGEFEEIFRTARYSADQELRDFAEAAKVFLEL